MNQKLRIAIWLLAAFVLWTVLICFVDVQAIGPEGSTVGFAAANRFIHDLTGVHMGLYIVTDWLGLVPLAVAMGFGFLGLSQWIRRKSLRRVDFSILVLGGFYAAVMMVFLFFEAVGVNFRPVLINGVLEASYPSSTTMLVMCVMPTAAMQLKDRVRNPALKRCITIGMAAFTAFMVVGRLLSGVHWFTDIVGGTLLSAGLVMLYASACIIRTQKAPTERT